MNVGDRVRLLTGTEEGIITRLLDSELVEVAIDNDFTIPVLRREVVVVSAEEGQNFRRLAPEPPRPGKGSGKGQPKTPAPKAKGQPAPAVAGSAPAAGSASPGKAAPAPPLPPAPKGLYLALVHQSPELLSVHLINNTEAQILFTYGEERPDRPYRGLAADKLAPKAASAPLGHFHLKDFEEWPSVVVQLLSFQLNGNAPFDLLTKRQQFRAASFYSSRRPAPVIGKEAYLFQLDEKPAPALTPEKLAEPKAPATPTGTTAAAPAPAAGGVDVSALLAQLSGDGPARPATAPKEPAKAVEAPPHEVDLHLDALRPDGGGDLSNAAILRLQLDAFEDALSRALATNMHEIVFIHGLGNGTLRKEMHRQLSRNKDIKFFEDAQKGKFGYGATLVRLK